MDRPGAAAPAGSQAVAAGVDPFTAEIVRQALVAATDEMKTNLMRTAYNMIITEGLDFTVGLFDAAGDTLSIGLGLPMFIRGMSVTVKAQVAHFGAENLAPGDILLTNDSYIHGSHLNHMVFTLPIFSEGGIVAYACTMAHWQDIGGTLGGRTTDIYSEGIQLPIIKAFEAGRRNEDLLRIIRANVRFPELAMGDFRAQIAALRTGERRMTALLERYGRSCVVEVMRAVMDASEARARKAVAAMPDGEYAAESFLDDDGIREGRPIPIRVRVVIEGDRMRVDLTDVAEQVQGYYNAGDTAGRSAAQVAFKCMTTPLDLPINDGAFRPLEVLLPPGRVVSARKPAAVRKWMTVPMTVADTIFRAMAPAIPDRVAAGHHADLLSVTMFGLHPRTGRFYTTSFGSVGGGWGAKHDSDGSCSTYCLNDGDSHNRPVEVLENRYPLIIDAYALRTDSGGAGRWRGGLGAVRAIRPLGPARFNAGIERTQCAPWGLFGGRDAQPNRIWVVRRDGQEVGFPSGKVDSLQLEAGDVAWIAAGGGGGFGDPLLRPVADVVRDVVAGYVSPEAAERGYGVRVDPGDGSVLAVTAERQASEREARHGHDETDSR
jgi:N-methylhydantoinase B